MLDFLPCPQKEGGSAPFPGEDQVWPMAATLTPVGLLSLAQASGWEAVSIAHSLSPTTAASPRRLVHRSTESAGAMGQTCKRRAPDLGVGVWMKGCQHFTKKVTSEEASEDSLQIDQPALNWLGKQKTLNSIHNRAAPRLGCSQVLTDVTGTISWLSLSGDVVAATAPDLHSMELASEAERKGSSC